MELSNKSIILFVIIILIYLRTNNFIFFRKDIIPWLIIPFAVVVAELHSIKKWLSINYGGNTRMFDTGSEPCTPSSTGTGARWAGSGWNTPLAAQWADSRIAWREGNAGRKAVQKAVKKAVKR